MCVGVQVTRGVMYTREEAEGKRLKHPLDTITEGIGINRVTRNFNLARVDGAFRGSDAEAVEMVRCACAPALHSKCWPPAPFLPL